MDSYEIVLYLDRGMEWGRGGKPKLNFILIKKNIMVKSEKHSI